MKNIAVLGSGVVGQTLANGYLKHGYKVMRGSRDPKKLEDWRDSVNAGAGTPAGAGPNASVGTFAEAARFGEHVVLAVKGDAAESAVALCEAGLDGKVVIDTTNPIASGAPTNGVLQYFTTMNDSLMERLQKKVPAARFVKAFSCVGNAFMVDPDFGGVKPSMFICGNDERAKAEVKTTLAQFGWEVEDMGAVEAARAIEPLCMLWCIPGLRGGGWSHAFKLLKK
jgi:predicted dinucleotide-binding enzyme